MTRLIFLFFLLTFASSFLMAQKVHTHSDRILIDRITQYSTFDPSNPLYIRGALADSSQYLIYAKANNEDRYNSWFDPAVYGENIYFSTRNNRSAGYGVFGEGGSVGVYGYGSDREDNLYATGVYGDSRAVYGTGVSASGRRYGLYSSVPDSFYVGYDSDLGQSIYEENNSASGSVYASYRAKRGNAIYGSARIDTAQTYQSSQYRANGVYGSGEYGGNFYGKIYGIFARIEDSISYYDNNLQQSVLIENTLASNAIYGTNRSKRGSGVYGYGKRTGLYGFTSDSVYYYNPATQTGSNVYNSYAFAAIEGRTQRTPWAGYFSNDIYISGSLIQPSLANASQQKKNDKTKPLENSIEKLRKLKVIQFDGEDIDFDKAEKPNGTYYGLYSDQVKEQFPALVRLGKQPIYKEVEEYEKAERMVPVKVEHPVFQEEKNESGETVRRERIEKQMELQPETYFKKVKVNRMVSTEEHLGINYVGFVPVLIQTIQEQQKQIDELVAVVAELRKEVEGIKEQANSNTESRTIVVPKFPTQSRLDQNTPNPTDGSTSIRFFIPESATTAVLQLHDLNGKLLHQESITTRGEGQLQFDLQNLSNNIYAYTLLVDGRIVDNKKMILTR
ncbi:MAG: hypothetical protein AAGI23_14925 [Bacteroidota bacterium]